MIKNEISSRSKILELEKTLLNKALTDQKFLLGIIVQKKLLKFIIKL